MKKVWDDITYWVPWGLNLVTKHDRLHTECLKLIYRRRSLGIGELGKRCFDMLCHSIHRQNLFNLRELFTCYYIIHCFNYSRSRWSSNIWVKQNYLFTRTFVCFLTVGCWNRIFIFDTFCTGCPNIDPIDSESININQSNYLMNKLISL